MPNKSIFQTATGCSRRPSAELRAIINDPDLKENKATAIFGTNKEDSVWSHFIKQVGYPLSAIFLVITLVVYIIVPELRRVFSEWSKCREPNENV
jgi:hypothetical protein